MENNNTGKEEEKEEIGLSKEETHKPKEIIQDFPVVNEVNKNQPFIGPLENDSLLDISPSTDTAIPETDENVGNFFNSYNYTNIFKCYIISNKYYLFYFV